MTDQLHQLNPEVVFAELRSACNQQDYDKAHHCVRWFLLYARDESIESALHYAINTVHVDMHNSYKWPWWLSFIRQGKKASLSNNRGEFFRIINPSYEVMFR